MNREDAKAQLDATTLRPEDASDEARELARTDTDLGQWLGRRRAFDDKVAVAMEAIPVPAELQVQLLAAMHAEAAKTPQRRSFMAMPMTWLAAAAVFVLSFAAWWALQPGEGDWEGQALATVKLIDHGLLRLDHQSPRLDDLRKTLARAGSLSPGQLPVTLEKLRTYGCKVIQVAGKQATVVCFEMPGGDEAHLVVLEKDSLPNLPAQPTPLFTQRDGWQLASWSDGTRSLILMTSAAPDKLRALFAAGTGKAGAYGGMA